MVDVGWYRTTIRSFERERFNIPNSVFSRNVVLNVTRKGKEWRFYEFIGASSLLYPSCLFVLSYLAACTTQYCRPSSTLWVLAVPNTCVDGELLIWHTNQSV